MKTDIEISQEAVMKPIKEVALSLGVKEEDLELYGTYKAKLSNEYLNKIKANPDGEREREREKKCEFTDRKQGKNKTECHQEDNLFWNSLYRPGCLLGDILFYFFLVSYL